MLSFVCGFVFGAVYEAMRLTRLILRLKIVTFLCDVVFFFLSAEFVFRLSLIFGDHIRIYTILGFGCGIFAYITTIGRILNSAEGAAAIVWRHTLGRLLRYICKKVRDFIGAFAHIMTSGFGKVADFFAIGKKKTRSPLNFQPDMMYNDNTDYIGEGSDSAHGIKATIRRSS